MKLNVHFTNEKTIAQTHDVILNIYYDNSKSGIRKYLS